MPNSLRVALQNNTSSDQVFAYVTGIAIQHGGQRCLLKKDGQSLYFPQNPPAIGSPLTEDCAIPLGSPKNTVTLKIPQIAGGRIWFSRNGKLTFLLNPGPALVEPSVLNPSDPNAAVDFGFMEFTLNDAQLYANISYVDFVPRLPIAMCLQTAAGDAQHVGGMAPDGLDSIASGLRAQTKNDGWPWDKLIVQRDGKPLRVLNATHGNAVGASFNGYYEKYVDEVWQYFTQRQAAGKPSLKIDTQAADGVLTGTFTDGGELYIGGETFKKPTTADILGCNSGPFTTGPSPTRNAIIPRLAAAFVRTALTATHAHPSQPETFYCRDPTNHYARLVHLNNADGKGYAFAYDDVQPEGGDDQSGKVNAGDPVLLTVTVGGFRKGQQ
ncbi:glycoside hydrolase family 64 protein [Xylariaceae sp. FL0804]|nr:glycoside hydrolase family 64 protein [Xylariaceae sp. FL0804]